MKKKEVNETVVYIFCFFFLTLFLKCLVWKVSNFHKLLSIRNKRKLENIIQVFILIFLPRHLSSFQQKKSWFITSTDFL